MGNQEGADLLRWHQGQVRSVSVFNLYGTVFIHKRSRGSWTSSFMTVTPFFQYFFKILEWANKYSVKCWVSHLTRKCRGKELKSWRLEGSENATTPTLLWHLVSFVWCDSSGWLWSAAPWLPAPPSPLPTFPGETTSALPCCMLQESGWRASAWSSREESMESIAMSPITEAGSLGMNVDGCLWHGVTVYVER